MLRGIFQTSETSDPLLRAGDALARRARLWLFWERYAPVLAVAVLCAAIFVAGAYIGLWERIGDPWRAVALIVSLYFIARAFIAARAVTPPSQSEARRRVETDSGVSHRPLETLRDSPVLGDALWAEHQSKARLAAEKLTAASPVAVIGPRDKYLLRFIAPIVLGLAVITGFGDNRERLRRALSPSWQSPIDPADVTFDAWVDPPDYTGRPPVYFKGKQTVAIPAGSELVARIQGAKTAPRLKLSSGGLFGTKYLKLTRLGPKSFEARTVLKKSASAGWRVGMTRRTWTLNVLEDTPPTLGWVVEPAADKRDRLSFQYYLKDDYGVEQLELEMTLLEDGALGSDGDIGEKSDTNTDASQIPENALRVNVPLTGASVRETKGTDAVLDLTKHLWAGRKVSARLIAKDGKGQSVASGPAFFTVPDKIFIEHLAKAVAEQRTLVMAGLAGDAKYAPLPRRTRRGWQNMPVFDDWRTDTKLGRAPDDIQRAAVLIDAITDVPASLYKDPAVYMGLRNVLSTLRHSREIEDLTTLPSTLWDIAIRAEFGTLGSALEEMQAAQAALNEGMARRAPQREIDTLFNRYDEAVERYIEELTKKAMEDMADSEGGGEGGGGRNADEIEELLKAIEEANRIGDTEGARKALKKLAELLENMKIQMAQGSGSGDGDPSQGEMSEEMKESLEDLADLLGEQRELQDETEQAEKQAENEGGEQQGSPSGNGAQSGGETPSGEGSQNGQEQEQQALSSGELAERQSKLQELLDGVREKLPEGLDAPAGLGNGDEEGDEARGGGEEDEDAQNGGGGDLAADGKALGGATGDGKPLANPDTSLSGAAEAMRRAEDALKSGNLDEAAKAQAEVIAALRAAASALAEQSRGEDGQQTGQEGDGNPLGQEAQDGDNGGNNDFTQQDIDQRNNAERSRELMEELRRRAAEQEREPSERDYLERLLKRF